MNLRHTKGVNIRALIFHVKDFIPLRRHLQTFVNREDAVPVETGVGLVAIQFELFIRGRSSVDSDVVLG
jgi:hypothetical protein